MQSLETLENQLHFYWDEFQQGKMTKGDIVAVHLLLLHELFPTPHWLIWNPRRQHTTGPLDSMIYPKQLEFWKTHPLLEKIPDTFSLGQIINHSNFKKETLRAILGLVHIFNRPNTVQILDYIPTPMQVLEMQSNGYRCVTLLRTQNWFQHQFDHKRNLRDFIIHDLEHIWQMFEIPTLTKSQIQFSKKLFELTQLGHFDSILAHSDFKPEFDYIISDMNTHPSHTFATLKALLIRHQLSVFGVTKGQLTSSHEEKIALLLSPFETYVI